MIIISQVYLYERITWTNQAKLKEFKRQYVDHAARKLRLIVDMTSANCSHQVQQELSSTFARLCHLVRKQLLYSQRKKLTSTCNVLFQVDESTAEMKDNAKTMERNIKELEDIASKAKVLRNQATFLGNKLEMFESTYLQTE